MAVLRQWKLEFGEGPESGSGAAAGPEFAARGAESAARRTANQELHAIQCRSKAWRRGPPEVMAYRFRISRGPELFGRELLTVIILLLAIMVPVFETPAGEPGDQRTDRETSDVRRPTRRR